jgi:hypothetical protein
VKRIDRSRRNIKTNLIPLVYHARDHNVSSLFQPSQYLVILHQRDKLSHMVLSNLVGNPPDQILEHEQVLIRHEMIH